MAKSHWGIKRICSNCSTKFYDLLRLPIVCPKCNKELELKNRYKEKNVTKNHNNSDEKNIDDKALENKDKDLSMIIEGEDMGDDENNLIDISKDDDESAPLNSLEETIIEQDDGNNLDIEIDSDNDNKKDI